MNTLLQPAAEEHMLNTEARVLTRLRMALVGMGCGMALLSTVLLGSELAPAPATLEAAAAVTLRQRDIPFRRVAIESAGCIPVPENCQSYSGDIVVSGERPARGRIVCREPAQRCTIWIADLDLRGVPVPDPAIAGRGGWVETIRARWAELCARVLP